MSIVPRDMLDLSRRYADTEDETTLRMCAGRAYYAAFHCAGEVSHLCPDVDVSGLGDHKARIKRFKDVPTKRFKGSATARQIGGLLGQAYALRLIADYELKKDISSKEVHAQNRIVSRLFDLVSQFHSERLEETG